MNQSEKLPIEWIERIFMRLHGRFGNAFFDKYRIGSLNETGQDLGIENAKVVWSEELAGISPERIKAALFASYTYAPSCDEFRSNCFIRTQPKDYKELAAPVDYEGNRKQAEKLVSLVAEICKPKKDYKLWARDLLAANERGEKVSEYALKMAREVLAINTFV